MRLINADALVRTIKEYWDLKIMESFSPRAVYNHALEAIENAETVEEPDGCFGCRYEDLAECDNPCLVCRNNYRNKYEPKRSDLISRGELFNRLATIHAPMEANEYKAEVYKTIQTMKGE